MIDTFEVKRQSRRMLHRRASRVTRWCLAWTLLALAGACSRAAAPDTGRFVAPTGAAADVYRTVLDSLARTPAVESLMLAESTVVFRAPAGIPVTWQEFDRVPVGLPERLESMTQSPRSSASLPLPRPIVVLTRAESEQIRQAQPRAWWTEFARRYPGQRAVLAFSPIAFSNDSTSALVEFVSNCGDNCGGGQLVWMERRAGGVWTVRHSYTLWVN